MVVAAADTKPRRRRALHQLEAEHAEVEREGAVEVGHVEVDVPDMYSGVDRVRLRRCHRPQ